MALSPERLAQLIVDIHRVLDRSGAGHTEVLSVLKIVVADCLLRYPEGPSLLSAWVAVLRETIEGRGKS